MREEDEGKGDDGVTARLAGEGLHIGAGSGDDLSIEVIRVTLADGISQDSLQLLQHLKRECDNSDEILRWLPYRDAQCTRILNVQPKQVQKQKKETTEVYHINYYELIHFNMFNIYV